MCLRVFKCTLHVCAYVCYHFGSMHAFFLLFMQQSWEDKMVERVQNVIKRDHKRLPSSAGSLSENVKRSKLSSEARKKIHY